MNTDWMEDAACREWPQGQFFPEEGSRHEPWRRRRAIAVCEGCPVRRPCLDYALRMERSGSIPLGYAHFQWRVLDALGNEVGQTWRWRPFTASTTPPHGIWGGFTAEERHAKAMKHLPGCKKHKCQGCKSLEAWVNDLLEGSTAA